MLQYFVIMAILLVQGMAQSLDLTTTTIQITTTTYTTVTVLLASSSMPVSSNESTSSAALASIASVAAILPSATSTVSLSLLDLTGSAMYSIDCPTTSTVEQTSGGGAGSNCVFSTSDAYNLNIVNASANFTTEEPIPMTNGTAIFPNTAAPAIVVTNNTVTADNKTTFTSTTHIVPSQTAEVSPSSFSSSAHHSPTDQIAGLLNAGDKGSYNMGLALILALVLAHTLALLYH